MSYRVKDIVAGDPRLIGFNADAPLILARNILEPDQAVQPARWNSVGVVGGIADPDISWPTFPGYCSVDGRANRATLAKPSLDSSHSALTTATDLYLVYDQRTTYRGGTVNCADTLIVWIANLLDILSAGITFRFELANDEAFSSGLIEIAIWDAVFYGLNYGNLYTPNFNLNARAYCYQLANPSDSAIAEYENVQYARLHFLGPAGVFATIQPQVLELWFGPRRQLSRQPSLESMVPELFRDFDPLMSKSEAASGQRADLVFAESRTIATPSWDPIRAGSDPTSGIDDAAQLLQAYRECHHGTRSFVFVPNPLTAPEVAYLYKADSAKFGVKRYEGTRGRSLSGLTWVEQPPFVDDEQPDLGCGGAPFSNLHSIYIPTNSGDYASIDTPSGLTVTVGITVSFWFRIDTPLGGATVGKYVVSQWDNTAGGNWSVEIAQSDGSGNNCVKAHTGGESGVHGPYVHTFRAGPATFSTGVWHHVMVVMPQNGLATAYMDGSAMFDVTHSNTAYFNNFTAPLSIGARGDGGSLGAGPMFIDEAAVFVDVLKSGADAARYALGPIDMSLETGCVSFFRFEGDLRDSADGNDLTVHGAATLSTEHP